MVHDQNPDSLVSRLRNGLDRIALVLRADLWAAAGAFGLNPVQAQVLGLLAGRPSGLRAKDIAAGLAVSAPSIADTLAALDRKGLIRRQADPGDARVVIVRASAEGLRLGAGIAAAASEVGTALAGLPVAAQEQLLLTQISLIHQLQAAGAIPMQRMCVSCCHLSANAYPGTVQPHHCAFIGAAIGTPDLRLDCGEHEAADPAIQAATWMDFAKGTPTLQAQP